MQNELEKLVVWCFQKKLIVNSSNVAIFFIIGKKLANFIKILVAVCLNKNQLLEILASRLKVDLYFTDSNYKAAENVMSTSKMTPIQLKALFYFYVLRKWNMRHLFGTRYISVNICT